MFRSSIKLWLPISSCLPIPFSRSREGGEGALKSATAATSFTALDPTAAERDTPEQFGQLRSLHLISASPSAEE
ncbi:uncharacterized protein N7473_012111 [Penicillium subrubescens]|uniref:Uncharacterized protein n=1 Tax=Penicillium subrubescens TaxID=1316194 RepID=A0A1Q5UPM6_9EURO|nr:uncharacterized protein N7473_012111 [Penicillium subrubescens]KAJ5881058.1 hypothetical protein N7473_012111 [Penicillium subrubescens]OKP14419.1 hypothetical protein PENSUB_14031 [Penicillium subrubescens]